MQRRDFTKLLGGLAGTGLAGTATADRSGFDPALQDDPLDRIEIKTTAYDESHIYVGEDVEDSDEGDLYALGYGNGYVQARDRLFQIDVIRHIGHGNSARLLGPAQLPSDIQVRRDLYSPEEIRRQWESASRTIRKVVKGYADGVNRRMTEMAAQGDLPVEFATPRPLPTPIDVPGADTSSSEDATTDSGATGDDAADTAGRPTGHVTDDADRL